MLFGDHKHLNRRLPVYVLEREHVLVLVKDLGFHFPARYLTEYAVVLAHPLLVILFVLSSTAPARATATTPAVSLRNLNGPSDAGRSPAPPASASSPSPQPPSGPTNKPTAPSPTTSSIGGRSGPACSNTPPSPASRAASAKGTGSPTSGMRRRRDCRAAARATRRHRSTLPSPRESLTTPRSVASGTMRPTPSSVAFSTTRSMCRPLGTAW